VQIAEYVGGRQRIVRHVGSAHSEAELGVLLARARVLLEPCGQSVLDLGVEPTPVVMALLAVPAAQPGLFDAAGEAGLVRASAARVVSTDARVLFEALAGLYSSLGFDAVGDEVFRDLVIARVVEPSSLLDTARVLTDLGRAPASYATMKRTLTRAVATGASTGADAGAEAAARGGSYRDQIAALCFTHALTSGDVSLVLYGTTTLYFEAEQEDDLRKVGYSKERRVDPKSWSGCWSTGRASRWRSDASPATGPRPPPSSRSSRRSPNATRWPRWSWSPTPGCSRART
jgi:hypothetical protein